jgi:GNAT superfamily N-acetyltransferase
VHLSRVAPRLTFALAAPADAASIMDVRIAAARDLTARFGRGHWSGEATERGVLFAMRTSPVWIARRGRIVVATFRLGTRKPWAIDPAYFTPVKCPWYLTDMAVRPNVQRLGIGRRCIERMIRIARAGDVEAIRLDAYHSEGAGAGPFYANADFAKLVMWCIAAIRSCTTSWCCSRRFRILSARRQPSPGRPACATAR